ncbi:hypothetical protein P9239_17960 [Caballeronia sp. LZ062]|uniref:hypothetical protein n=1 Tax=unclassified Caballeronia TaxID=2646786 RepID=UPI00285A042B|nr:MULTISPECIES: hypothetical protein [unclassified Caballeronia]MDR5855981.1 hypothetical protein [Caballeronia sp. LZ050]MDR5872233.1 hypothetical protein [Caballeronia sp. LZ062]
MKIRKLYFAIDFSNLDLMTHARKMFGKMRKLLKDADLVSFQISVTLYREGIDEPRTISMKGARSANGAWITRFTRDLESDLPESPEALRSRFSRAQEAVRSYIVDNELSEDWIAIEAELREAMKSGGSVDALEYHAQIPVRAIANYGNDAHLYAPLMATAYLIEGTDALVRNALEHASYCVERARYWSSSEMLIPNPRHRFKERARAGGHGKAANYEPVKARVIELLTELEPDGGWISGREAIDRVADELAGKACVQLVEGCGMEPSNLPRTIGGWVKEQPERFRYRIRPKA